MTTPSNPRRPKVVTALSGTRAKLLADLTSRIIGQPDALEQIIPRYQMYAAGLSPDNRPAGIFMLLGPTGTGKTATVEALAEVIHGSRKNVLRIDCGEYQMEHEVAKLIGAPPGYLGHRETQPILTQMKLNAVMSARCNLAIILFDEIEKAASSMLRLLLGVLDKGRLQLGDNTTVQFEQTLIFFTSNLGSAEMSRELGSGYGLSAAHITAKSIQTDLTRITMGAIKRRLSPEFINRVDVFLTYKPLSESDMLQILEIQLIDLSDRLNRRLGDRSFFLRLSKSARDWLIANGFSKEYGARELKRTIDRQVLQPLADLLADGEIAPGAIVDVKPARGGKSLTFQVEEDAAEGSGSVVTDRVELRLRAEIT